MAKQEKSLLERALGLVAEVEAGEGINVVLMFINIFLILTAYYVLKVIREALTIGGVVIFGVEGDEAKAYLSAIMAILLVGIVPLYGLLASKVDRIKLVQITMGFVIVCLGVFFVWGRATGVSTAIGLSFFVWLGIVNIFLVAQFWSYGNDIYTESQGKRLFVIIAIGQSLGAWVGPNLAKLGADHLFSLFIVCGAILVLCLGLYMLVNRREQGRDEESSSPRKVEEPLARDGGFQLVFQTRYLLLIALMILVTNLVNSTGEFILSNAAKNMAKEEASVSAVLGAEVARTITSEGDLDAAARQKLKDQRGPLIGKFYGSFYSVVNLVGLLVQMFLVSRIFKYLGVRVALFILPVIAFGGYLAIGVIGGILVLRIAKTAENATDYSLQNTVKQALFLPTSREAKYKAKAAIDTFFVRFGDAASAGVVWLGVHQLAFGAREFAYINVALCAVWIALCAGIAREHRRQGTMAGSRP